MRKLLLSSIALSAILAASCKNSDNTAKSSENTENVETVNKATSAEERNKAKFFELVEAEINYEYRKVKKESMEPVFEGKILLHIDEEKVKTYRADAEYFFSQNEKLPYQEAFVKFSETNRSDLFTYDTYSDREK